MTHWMNQAVSTRVEAARDFTGRSPSAAASRAEMILAQTQDGFDYVSLPASCCCCRCGWWFSRFGRGATE